MPANGSTAPHSGVEADEKPETQRIALVIQYQGTHFHGWQRQLNQRTVQAEIEQVLEAVLSKPTTLHGSGRTDSGVHAAAQVAHFDATTLIPAHRWAAVLNSRLPDDILIRASVSVTKSWHARFSACSRRYRYTIYTDARPNLFVRPYSWHYYLAPLDAEAMQTALKPLSGRQHLAAFHRAGSSRPHSWVEMQAAECERQGAFIRIELQASGFLYGMVRLIVGMLVEVGRGIRSPGQFTELWQQQRRDLVKYAAPPQGLCLLRVGYPDFPVAPEVWFDSQPKLVLPADPVFCLI
ncbi:MAG: tRNA pseudouridine(38-40) synthase TruA [Pegethrix bostrychoides GSE-TBD4-15B]|jgi:tRNA pseudouridine38-40 synthase|uniref:tRNA pseudouridine synthase A n=1 Tax=Pegethrix bostrychoides GSE-TBD4-15B TaxID=2839662 RepID=A0A951PFF7_9CYAN|nr:tRNA pseudouridine(38-40) synthase TruA [Pegethrix bostrychoides GSE-TBD4-15B]